MNALAENYLLIGVGFNFGLGLACAVMGGWGVALFNIGAASLMLFAWSL